MNGGAGSAIRSTASLPRDNEGLRSLHRPQKKKEQNNKATPNQVVES